MTCNKDSIETLWHWGHHCKYNQKVFVENARFSKCEVLDKSNIPAIVKRSFEETLPCKPFLLCSPCTTKHQRFWYKVGPYQL